MNILATMLGVLAFILSSLLNCLVYPFSRKAVFKLMQKEAVLILRILGVRLVVVRDDFTPSADPDSNYLFISNHQSSVDILVMLALQPRLAGFIAKKELFRVPFLHLDLGMCGSLSIDRHNLKKGYKDIQKAVSKLRNRQSLHMFPEGTRNLDEGILPLKKGFLRIANESEVPVVPIIIHGTRYVMNKKTIIATATKNPKLARVILDKPYRCAQDRQDLDLAAMNARFTALYKELEETAR